VIFAGIRTSAVQVVASATLATFIGGGGLGELIVLGFQRNDLAVQIGGSLAVAVLAIITELTFGVLERTFTPKGLLVARKRRGK
jgi:osmoprotectant transport system permease protein